MELGFLQSTLVNVQKHLRHGQLKSNENNARAVVHLLNGGNLLRVLFPNAPRRNADRCVRVQDYLSVEIRGERN